jgi:hypothetical protein
VVLAVQNIDKEPVIAGAVFTFAAVASVCFVIVMERFGAAFNGYIDNLNKMDGACGSRSASWLPSTIKTVQLLLWLACVISVCGVVFVAHRAGFAISLSHRNAT